MSSSSVGEWSARQAKLLLSFFTFALDLWAIWQAIEPDRPIPVVKAELGTPEYVAAAIFLTLATMALLTAWSRQFWPSVRFKALHGAIAACRDDAVRVRRALQPELKQYLTIESLDDLARFHHRSGELRADLNRLRIKLPKLQQQGANIEAVDEFYGELRRLAIRAHVGDIRGARTLWNCE